MALKALIFDVDGTLANTERNGHLVAFNLAFEKLGLNWHWSNELYCQLLKVTGGQLRIKYYIKNYKPEFKCDAIDVFVKETHALKTKIYTYLMDAGDIPLRTGVTRLLNEARKAGLRLAIATTTTPINVDSLIANTLGRDTLAWFEVIGTGDVVSNLKPAGDIYHWVIEKMNLKADECIAFEDSHNGIVSATNANLKTLVTINEYTESHSFEDAMVVLNHLGNPNKPFAIIKGDATDATYVNVNYLKELYAKYC